LADPKSKLDIEMNLQCLVAKIAKGDRQAFEAFYDLTRRRIYGIALKILKEPDLAEEATLDIYLKIWNQADHYRPSSGLVTVWSNVIARNRSLDYLRKRQRRESVELPLIPDPGRNDEAESPEGYVFRAERANRLFEAMSGLGEESRQLIMASFFQGLSHGEIAKEFDQPLGTVKTRIRKALEYLRNQLGKTE